LDAGALLLLLLLLFLLVSSRCRALPADPRQLLLLLLGGIQLLGTPHLEAALLLLLLLSGSCHTSDH
jgi:hypothetical protein